MKRETNIKRENLKMNDAVLSAEFICKFSKGKKK